MHRPKRRTGPRRLPATRRLVDDLRWADAPSLRWLAHLVRRLEGLPLLLALGTKPPDQSEQAALRTELLTDPAAVVLAAGNPDARVGGDRGP